ncbi:MAG: cytochrome C oxidase subunit IV family protein [Acidimicrobiia bacterium]
MSDETNIAVADDPALPGTPEQRAAEAAHGMSAIPSSALPMLPGEVRPHPSPFQYVMIAVILCVITGLEVGMYYLTDSIPRALYVAILLSMALTKFVTVVSWYMHLRSDRPIFRRLFIVGGCGALTLYMAVLATLHVFE